MIDAADYEDRTVEVDLEKNIVGLGGPRQLYMGGCVFQLLLSCDL